MNAALQYEQEFFVDEGPEPSPVLEQFDRRVTVDGVELTVAEVRRVYDNLPKVDRETVKALAQCFVACARAEHPKTRYNFDDGLCDAARLSVNMVLAVRRRQ